MAERCHNKYKLNIRYYDPAVCRFVSADDVAYLGADTGLTSLNLYSYCVNDPVNRFDENGNLSLSNAVKLGIGALALGGAIALTVATGGAAAAVAIGVAKIVGGVALNTVINAGVGYLENGTQGAIDGACNGFMFGSLAALTGAASGLAKIRAATRGSSNSMGQLGENLAGIDPKAKRSIRVNGRIRIPDALTDTVLKEVKNVKCLSNTQQLKDFATYAQATNRAMELWVRPTTKIAKTAIESGRDIYYL